MYSVPKPWPAGVAEPTGQVKARPKDGMGTTPPTPEINNSKHSGDQTAHPWFPTRAVKRFVACGILTQPRLTARRSLPKSYACSQEFELSESGYGKVPTSNKT